MFIKFGSKYSAIYDGFSKMITEAAPTVGCIPSTNNLVTSHFCSSYETCDDLLPKLEGIILYIDSNIFTVPPQSFTKSLGTQCQILISYDTSNPQLSDDVTFGLPWFEDFIVAYNYTSGISQFAVSKNANFGAEIINNPDWIRYVN